jgi:hypothetical protein
MALGKKETWKNLEKRSGDGVGGGLVILHSPFVELFPFVASFVAISEAFCQTPDLQSKN